MKKRFSRRLSLGILVVVSTFTFTLDPSMAQAHSSHIPIQGQLTDTNGNPLNGQYDLTTRIYDVPTEGSPLCTAINYGIEVKNGIYAVLLRRQTGVCETASCFASLLYDAGVLRSCDKNVPANAAGCTLHFALNSNNVLTSQSGILYLTLELAFSGPGTFVDIGGARLMLEHD